MKPLRVLVAAVLVCPVIATIACDDASPLDPETAVTALAARATGPTNRPDLPFHGATAGQLVSMEPAPPGRCPPDLPMLFSYRGEGTATHMGRFTVEGSECAFLDPSDLSTARTGHGEFTLTAANGDELNVGYSAAVLSMEGPASPWIGFHVPSVEATGGTGRFAGAELVDVAWNGGVHLGTFETYSTLDGRIAFR
jgi:hypothetical protein